MTSQVHEVRCLAVHSPAKDPPTMTTLGRLVVTMGLHRREEQREAIARGLDIRTINNSKELGYDVRRTMPM